MTPCRLLLQKREFGRQNKQKILRKIIAQLNFPVVIKPNNLGSSLGISIPKNQKQLASAINFALKYSPKILAEEYIKGREIHCGIIETKKIIALPLDEVKPKNEFYDYEAKYKVGMSEHITPAQLPKNITKKIQNLAIKIFKLVECKGMARVDFLLKGKKFILMK
jgi:D-alanine-D-alanine ligase